MYHQQITEGNIINNITENIDLIAHFHAACTPGRNELWLGENDYEVIFNAINKTGYNGFCGIEYTPIMEPTESITEFKKRYMN